MQEQSNYKPQYVRQEWRLTLIDSIPDAPISLVHYLSTERGNVSTSVYLTVDDAEDLAQQILSLCQDHRNKELAEMNRAEEAAEVTRAERQYLRTAIKRNAAEW